MAQPTPAARAVDLSSMGSDPSYVPSAPVVKKPHASSASGLGWFAKTFSKRSSSSHADEVGGSPVQPTAALAAIPATSSAGSTVTSKKASSFAFWKKSSSSAAHPGTIKATRSPHTTSTTIAPPMEPPRPAPSPSLSSASGGVLYRPELSGTGQPYYDESLTGETAGLARPTNTRTASGTALPAHHAHASSFSEADVQANGLPRDRSESNSSAAAAPANPSSYYTSTYYSNALSSLTAFQPSGVQSRNNSRRPSRSATPAPPFASPAPLEDNLVTFTDRLAQEIERPASATGPRDGITTPVHVGSAPASSSVPSSAGHTPSVTSSSTSSSSSKLKLANFRKFVSDDVLDMDGLRKASWNGIPALARSISWKVLLGYLPANLARREATLKKRREEYRAYVEQYYDAECNATATATAGVYSPSSAASSSSSSGSSSSTSPPLVEDDSAYLARTTATTENPHAAPAAADVQGSNGARSEADHDILRQIRQDVPRTAPGIPFFKQARTQRSLERLLYIFAVRHPASGYVQGMNDVATPFYVVFLSEYLYPNAIQSESSTSSSATFDLNPHSSFQSASRLPPDMQAQAGMDVLSDPFSSSICLSAQQYLDLESDVFGCLSKLVDRIQDNYTFAQPGIQRMTFKMRELVQRIDAALDQHLESQHVQYIHFAFRWQNCLLMRELPMWCIIRIWDTYLAEDSAATASTGVGSTLSNSGGGGAGMMNNSTGMNGASGGTSGSGGANGPSSNGGPLSCSPQDFYTGFRAFHIYVCAAFLIHFSAQLRKLEFQELVLYLQKLPTDKWGVKEVETLLAQAFLYKSWFHSSPHQLK